MGEGGDSPFIWGRVGALTTYHTYLPTYLVCNDSVCQGDKLLNLFSLPTGVLLVVTQPHIQPGKEVG